MACLWPSATFELIINLKSATALDLSRISEFVPLARRRGDRNADVTVAVEMIEPLFGRRPPPLRRYEKERRHEHRAYMFLSEL